MHWKDRAVTIWQLTLATIPVLILLGGGLLSIYIQIHDIGIKIVSYDKVQEKLATIEAWKIAHDQQAQGRDREIEALKEQQKANQSTIQALNTTVTTLSAQAVKR